MFYALSIDERDGETLAKKSHAKESDALESARYMSGCGFVGVVLNSRGTVRALCISGATVTASDLAAFATTHDGDA